MIKCIYCNSEDLTVSDIIPYALTGAKVKKRFVCKYHNSYTNENFEKYVINDLSWFRKSIGLSTRDGKPIKYKASLNIQDITIPNVVLSSKKDFFTNNNRIYKTIVNGKNVRFGAFEALRKISQEKIEKVNLNNMTESFDFSLKELVTSSKMLRTVAKISYEWHCYINKLEYYDEQKYNQIVSYILDNNNDPMVENVMDENIYEILDTYSEYGTNSLFEYTDLDGYCYVVFCLWNVVCYKVKIFNTGKSNEKSQNILKIEKYNLDGTYNNSIFGLIGDSHIVSYNPDTALVLLEKFYINRLTLLVTRRVLTIDYLKKIIISTEKDLQLFTNKEITFLELIDYEDNDRVIAIEILEILYEKKAVYDKSLSFNKNLKNMLSLQGEDYFSTIMHDRYIGKLMELDADVLIDTLEQGIKVFNDILLYEKEYK